MADPNYDDSDRTFSSSTPTDVNSQSFSHICPDCSKSFATRVGLKIHHTKKHVARRNGDVDFISNEDQDTNTFEEKISSLKRSIPILKRIPKGARNIIAEKLSTCISEWLITNSRDAWLKLMLFSYECFRVPEKAGKKSLTSLVKENVSLQSLPQIFTKKRKSLTVQERVEKKIEDFDTKDALRIITSNDSMADINNQNFKKLVDMHPAPSRNYEIPDPPDDRTSVLQVREHVVQKSISSFPNGSSSGIDGISPQHLKDLISKSAGDNGNKLLTNITKLVNFMLEGKINCNVTKYIYGANICALNKKDGGLRPIAVGSTFRRLTAKVSCQAVQTKTKEYFQPSQLGFATNQGCETIIHATRTFIESNRNSNYVLLKVDYKNAFNCLERDVLLQEVQAHVPELYPFLWQCYASPSSLFFGSKTFPSQVGCQQGDPTSSLTFSLGIHPVVCKLKSTLKLFYLDDGTLAGDPKTIIEDIKILVQESNKIGLQINPTKCELYFTSTIADPDVAAQFELLLPGIKTVSSKELFLLGSPLCPEGFRTPLNEQLEKFNLMTERLKLLSKQVAFFLLKNCLGIPKLLYTIRTVPTFLILQEILNMDSVMKLCLEELMTVTLNETQVKQSSLPVHLGGIGIRSLQDLCLPAFLSSCYGALPLVSTILNISVDNLVLNSWTEGIEKWKTKNDEIPANQQLQNQWDAIVLKTKLEKELKFEDPKDVARFKALQNKEAGAWLHAFPSKNVGTKMDDQSFQIAVGLRLGCSLCRPFKCICGERVDEKGLHPLSCTKSSGRFFRHSEINNILKRALVSVNIPAQLEPSGMDRNDGKRPDGATIVPWSMGQCLVWNFTCTDTLAASYLPQTQETAGAAAELAVRKKHLKYSNIKQRGMQLVVLAVETMGVWCEEGRKWIDVIGKKMMEKTGDMRAKTFLKQQISLMIQRGNAASIMAALPSEENFDEIYYI